MLYSSIHAATARRACSPVGRIERFGHPVVQHWTGAPHRLGDVRVPVGSAEQLPGAMATLIGTADAPGDLPPRIAIAMPHAAAPVLQHGGRPSRIPPSAGVQIQRVGQVELAHVGRDLGHIPTQVTFSSSRGLNSRRSAYGAFRADLSVRVVDLQLCFFLVATPCSAVSAATC